MKFCPKCLQTAPDLGSGTYCIADGSKLVDCLKCGCGGTVVPGMRYCAGCGKAVTAYEPPKVVSP